MSSTITLLNSIEFTKRLNFGRRSNLGNFQEPALTSANIILSTFLSPPFRWRFNRAVIAFTTIIGVQDYVVSVPAFGWIEYASIQDPTISKWFEMENKVGLALDSSAGGRSKFISAQADDGAGNITFRLMTVPDKVYPVSVTVQKSATLFTSLSQTWAPIPDTYSYIYTWGFLAMMYMFADDPRFAQANSKFVGGLLATNSGLDDTEKNLFTQSWMAITGQAPENSARMNQGNQMRGI